jgi:PAS domain S-box-containing protein
MAEAALNQRPARERSEPDGLQEFWRIYDAHFEEVQAATMVVVGAHGELGPVIGAGSPPAWPRELIQRAVNGDWSGYEKFLRSIGAFLAERGVSISGWSESVAVFQRTLTPLLVRALNTTPERLTHALNAMMSFADHILAVVAEEFTRRKDKLATEQKKRAEQRERDLGRSTQRVRTLEVQRARDALQRNLDSLRLLVDHVQDYAICTIDPNGKVLTWNPGAERISGYRADEIVGQHFSRFYSQDDFARGKPELLLQTARTQGRVEDENWRLRRNGTRYWANVVITALFDDDRKVLGYAAIVRDFTERRKVEEKFRGLLESAPDAIVIVEQDGTIDLVNGQAEQLFGYSRRELIGRPAAILVPERYRRKAGDGGAGFFATAPSQPSADLVGLRRDGTEFPIDIRARVIQTAEGPLVSTVIRDITYRRKQEQEIARVNRFLDSIIDSIPLMVFVKDAEKLRFVRFNKAGEKLLGYRQEDMLGKSDYDFFPRSEADFFVNKDREVLAKGTLEDIPEEPIQTVTGQRFLHTKKIPILDESGRPLYLLGLSQDVTDLRKAELDLKAAYKAMENLNHQLEEQNRDLIRASRAKSDFLAMMSHELRTPLNSIIGFSEVLLYGKSAPLTDKQSRYLQNVLGSGRHLLALINGLLDLSKIEAGRLDIQIEACAPRVLVAEAIATLQPLADAGKLRVTFDPGSTSVPLVVGDPARIKQVLYNLLSNAIKFTPAGGSIDVGCAPLPDGYVRLTVADTGPGIKPEDLPRLFTPFMQLTNARERGGTGLGLALSKQLTELMHGRIGVESAPGAGARFWIDLPVAPEEARPGESGRQTMQPRSPLALIVEDDVASQELLQLSLQTNGFRTVVVSNGEDALAAARREHPSVITLDVFLPTIDGWDLLRVLRTDPQTSDIPVVIVSVSSDRQKAFGLGAAAHLTKPVDRTALVDALGRLSFMTKVREHPIHVLAVDDDPRQLEMIQVALRPHGFQVRTESSARAGLQAARTGPVDVVLLDLLMPDLSGFEVVAALRADDRTRSLPVLLLTAHDIRSADRSRLRKDVQAILAKGATGTDALLSEINRVLRREP